MVKQEPFKKHRGIYIPQRRLRHRSEEYDEKGFKVLLQMQRKHFWYRGRHKLLLSVLKKEIIHHFGKTKTLRAIDMGGGCGGWIAYLHNRQPDMFKEIALGDSSISALNLSGPLVGGFAERYQIDLLDIVWSEAWDVVFFLDVIEHIPNHEEVIRQICKSIRPKGLLFVTAPALNLFWTYNDELARHQRRYCRKDFEDLAIGAGLKLLRTDYFMFFLSPVLLLSRLLFRPPASATPEQQQEHLTRTHRIPARPVNTILSGIFSAESLMVNHIGFPWGTSILAVFQR